MNLPIKSYILMGFSQSESCKAGGCGISSSSGATTSH